MTGYRPKLVGPAAAPPIAPRAFDPMANAIITRCTRNGRIAWQAVANMMGRCLHSVRADYDPTYLRHDDGDYA